MRPTFRRHPEHRLTTRFTSDGVVCSDAGGSAACTVSSSSGNDLLEERAADLEDGVEIPAEEVVAVEAVKHFWHILFIAGFPVTPQLLMQGVMVSGTLKSVSSFSVF